MKIRKEVKIGFFAVVMLLALYWGINFLKGRDLFKNYNTFYTYYESVDGIQTAAPIVMKGIKIGSVIRLTYKPETNNVQLQISVKSSFDIPDDSVLRVSSASILGGKELTLELGSSSQMLKDGAVIMSTQDAGLFDLAGSELDVIKRRVGEILTQFSITLESLNKILGDGGEDIVGTLNNIRLLTASLNSTVNNDVKLMFGNINTLTGTLADNSAHLENLLSNLDDVSTRLSESEIDATFAELKTAVGELNQTLAKINNGDGSLGLLINDRALYDSLTVASGNLASLLSDLEANPKRYVHFSLFGGGKKNK